MSLDRCRDIDTKVQQLENDITALREEKEEHLEKILRDRSGEFTEAQFQAAIDKVLYLSTDEAVDEFDILVKVNDDEIEAQ